MQPLIMSTINEVITDRLFPKELNDINYSKQKVLEITQEKIQQLTTEKQIGINKKITKILIKNRKKKSIEVTQTYFSGLVYRLDGRSLDEITSCGGFYPKVNRTSNYPLLAEATCYINKSHDKKEIIGARVVTWKERGIIATSKNFSNFNVDSICWENDFKYVIDSTVDNLYGLDIDTTMQLPENSAKYEVSFEEPIKNRCIVGCFKGMNHNNAFYPNNLYEGNFSWNIKDVVINYKLQSLEDN